MQDALHLLRECDGLAAEIYGVANQFVQGRVGAGNGVIEPGGCERDARNLCVESYARAKQPAVGANVDRALVSELNRKWPPCRATDLPEDAECDGNRCVVHLRGGWHPMLIDRVTEDHSGGFECEQHRSRASILQ